MLFTANAACGDPLISTVTTYECNSPGSFTISSMPQVPSSGQLLYFQGEIKLENFCTATVPYHFAVVTIEPTTGTTVQLMDVYWDGDKVITYESDDTSGTKIIYREIMRENQPTGQWFSWTVWSRIAINQASGFFTYYGQSSSVVTNTPAYPAGWDLSKNPKIYLCSDAGGSNSIKCQVTNVKVWYQGPYRDPQVRDGTTPKLIAMYKLAQHSGYIITDSTNTLGPAYFGSSTSSSEDPIAANKPSWLLDVDPTTGKLVKEAGLKFDQSTQYATLPTFNIAESLKTPAYSFTLRFWIKLTTPGSEVYLFRYSEPSLAVDAYALKVMPTRRIKMINYDQSAEPTTQMSGSTWNSVIVTFVNMHYMTAPSTPSFYSYVTIVINDLVSDIGVQILPSTRFIYDPTNVVRIGGPPTILAIIADFEIYSPGTAFITSTSPCNYSTCKRDLGIMNPVICGLSQCSSNCGTCFSSGQAGCLSCGTNYQLYESKCVSMSCPYGKYLDGTNVCQNCIEHCDVCSDSITCTTCKSGFVNQGSICECPYRKYLDGNNICQNCIDHCDVCSDGITCTNCASGFINQGSICACPYGKYLDGTNICQNCIEHCGVCSDSITCTTCKSGFVNQGSICVCPSGFYVDNVTDTCKSLNLLCSSSSYFYYPGDKICRLTCEYPFKILPESPIQYCILEIDQEDADQAKQIAKVSSIASDATNLGGMLINMLSSNNPTLLLTNSLTEMLQYIQYLKINYPPKVQLMLEEQNVNTGGISIITEIPEEVANAIPNWPLPEEFAKNDTHSSYVSNTWELLITLSAIIISICVVLVLRQCLNKFPRIDSFLSKLLKSLKWNLFLGVFCSSYGFSGMYTALEFRTVKMSSGLSILSFITSLVMNVLGFFVFFIIVQLSVTFKTIKNTVKDSEERAKQIEETEAKWSNYEVLFGDYKDDFVSQKMYLFIYMMRTYVHYSFLGYLNEYPFLQTCGFTLISLAMILYMIVRRPIKGKLNYVQQMIGEVAILLVNICVLILALMEKWNIVDNATRVGVGNVIVGINLALSIATSVFLVIEVLSQIREAYSFIKTWRHSIKGFKPKKMGSIPPKSLYKVKTRRHNSNLQSNFHDLDISDLERKHETSIDQLKPCKD